MDSPAPNPLLEGNEDGKPRRHFIQQIIDADREAGLHDGRVHTRFPPEPNGFLHIGHAKAICVNFGLAAEYGGVVNLRFDDTNPVKEDTAYVDAIRNDIAWLGFEWNGGEHYTSDYFETLFGYAVKLIELGKAYVDEQSAEDIAKQKGTPTSPGSPSPYRDRPIDENLRLFREMREEIGTDKAEVLAESDDWYRYDLPEGLRDRLWGGRYVGQRQKWYALRYLGSDADINIETEHPEFMDWKWAPSATVPSLIVPFKRALYQQGMDELLAKIPPSLRIAG